MSIKVYLALGIKEGSAHAGVIGVYEDLEDALNFQKVVMRRQTEKGGPYLYSVREFEIVPKKRS